MNDQKLKPSVRLLLCALAIAGGLTLLIRTGLLDKADLWVSDMLYQTGMASEEYIVLIDIDQRALEEIGPYGQWGRDVMARVVETLNASPQCRPAAIGVDILFTGETQAGDDDMLAEAAGRYGNVVTACLAEFGSGLEEDSSGELYLNNSSIIGLDEPYAALKASSKQGHINAMLDADGILRHHLLHIALPQGGTIPSMALALTEMYREFHALPAAPLPPTDSRGFWYLPYCGAPGTFDESISVADILSGRRGPEYFAGKIVLIGPWAQGLQDSYLTAIDHAQMMYGVEYQANAVQALMRGAGYKREVSYRLQLALLFALLCIGVLGFWKRSVGISTALWLFLSAGWVLLCKMLYENGLVLHALWIPACVTVLYAGCLAFNYVQAALERHRVTSRFKKYVAPEIVREILKQGSDALDPRGKSTTIAVLFVDVRGFTSMSEKLDPEPLVSLLNRYLTLISDCILKNGGTLDKFIGDAAMAFWGAPLPQDDYVYKAVLAAADMVAGSAALEEELERIYHRRVSFGIGIHMGPAVVGNIGSKRRMDYTAIGDTVNTAERLESNAKGGEILISKAVAEALEGRIRTTPLGKIPLKGKEGGFDALRVEEIYRNTGKIPPAGKETEEKWNINGK